MQKLIPTLLLLAALIPFDVAYAAADLVSSEPSDRATLTQPPTEIRAVFSEQLTSESTLTLTDAQGRTVADGSSVAADDAQGRTLVLATRNLPPGRYTASWFTVSADDLSLAEGQFEFTIIGATTTATPTANPQPSPTRPPQLGATATRGTSQGAGNTPPQAQRTAQPTSARATAVATTATTSTAAATTAAPTATPVQGAGRTPATPESTTLPNTAGGAPGPWMFGGLAALAALAVWGLRRML